MMLNVSRKPSWIETSLLTAGPGHLDFSTLLSQWQPLGIPGIDTTGPQTNNEPTWEITKTKIKQQNQQQTGIFETFNPVPTNPLIKPCHGNPAWRRSLRDDGLGCDQTYGKLPCQNWENHVSTNRKMRKKTARMIQHLCESVTHFLRVEVWVGQTKIEAIL